METKTDKITKPRGSGVSSQRVCPPGPFQLVSRLYGPLNTRGPWEHLQYVAGFQRCQEAGGGGRTTLVSGLLRVGGNRLVVPFQHLRAKSLRE